MTTQGEGRLLNHRYQLVSQIGESETANVWKASDTVLARPVVVKMVNETYANHSSFITQFHAVSIAAARLSHPGIISIFDTGVDKGDHYVVMEWLDGITLQEILDSRRAQRQKNLATFEVARIGRKIALALSHAHRNGMMHGSLRPSQIIVTNDGDIKITDFGSLNTRSELQSAAPEVLRGGEPHVQSDLYSLGLVLYECLTGIPPFNKTLSPGARIGDDLPSPSLLVGNIPDELDDLIVSMTKSDPSKRPHDAQDVSRILKPYEWKTPSPVEDDVDIPNSQTTLSQELAWIAPVLVLFLISGFLMWKSAEHAKATNPETSNISPSPVVEVLEDDAIDSTAVVASAPIENVFSYDPQGDNKERDDLLPNLLDGASATLWQTEPYYTETFGGLKSGVGVILDIGQGLHIQDILVSSPKGGFVVDIAIDSSRHTALDDWDFVSHDNTIETGDTTITIASEQSARYILIWIKGPLPKSGDRYRAALSEVAVTFTPI